MPMAPLQVETLSHKSQQSASRGRILSRAEGLSDEGVEGLTALDRAATESPRTQAPMTPKRIGVFEPKQLVGLAVATILCIVFASIPLSDDACCKKAHTMLGIGAFVCSFWVFEVLPLPVSSLLPIVMMPLAGITTSAKTATFFWDWLQMMMIGAFLVNAAIEQSNLHMRVALTALTAAKVSSPTQVLLVFMFLAWFLSMVVSNTATTVMLCPLAIGILETSRELIEARVTAPIEKEARLESLNRFQNGLLLGICYSATAGGLGTIIGSAPNFVLIGMDIIADQIDFVTWMMFGLPVSIVVLLLVFLVLYFSFLHGSSVEMDCSVLDKKKAELGPMSRDEKAVSAIVIFMVILFCIRPFVFTEHTVSGVNDATVACLVGAIIFVVPSGDRPGEPLLTWKQAQSNIPWGVIMLIGGGFTLANGFEETGVTNIVGGGLGEVVPHLPLVVTVLLLVTAVTFMTELTSNTATALVMLPILEAVSYETLIHPMLLLVPVGMATSFAFSLPAATPPNSVIFATSRVSFGTFASTGIKIDVLAICIASFVGLGMVIVVFDALGPFPEKSCKINPVACQWLDIPGTVNGVEVSSQACVVEDSDELLCRLFNGTIVSYPAPIPIEEIL